MLREYYFFLFGSEFQLFQMQNEDKITNPMSFFSQENLFDFIYEMQTQRQQQTYLPTAFCIINAAIHILVFFSLPTFAYIQLPDLMSSMTLLITLAAFYGLVVVELLFYFIQKREFHLLEQIQFLCFVLQPLIVLATVSLIYSQEITYVVACTILVLCEMLSNFLMHTLLFQTYRTYTLKCRGNFLTVQMLCFQMVMISLVFISIPNITMIIKTMLLLITLNTHLTHFSEIQMDCIEFKALKAINALHIIFGIILITKGILGDIAPKSIYIAVSLVIYVYVVATLLKETKIDEIKLTKMLDENASYQQLLTIIDYITGVLKKQTNSQNLQLRSFIIASLCEHIKQCSKPRCDFISMTTLDQLRDPNPKNLKILIHKMLKKADELFQLEHKKSTEDKEIIFNMLKFFAYVYNNRNKLQVLLAETSHIQLTWSEQYQFYQYKRVCKRFQNTEAIDATKIDEDVIQFQNTLVSTLSFMQQFWAEFYEEKVDLKKIMIISSKIAPYKAKLQQIFHRKVKEEKYSSYKILILYSLYLRLILNQTEEALKIEDYARILGDRLKDKQEVKYLLKQTEAGFIVISLSETKLGSIHLMSDLALTIFRYHKKDIIGKNVSAIMPEIFAVKHDNILVDFLKKKRRTFNTDQRLLLGRDSNGLIFPVQLQLQKASYSANDQFIFIAMVKQQKLRAAPFFFTLDHEGEIIEYSSSFRNVFYRNPKKDKIKNIQEIIPNYFDENYREDTSVPRTFKVTINTHKVQNMDATFVVTPILVKGEHLGFLGSMTLKEQPSQNFIRNERLTEKLMKLRADEQLYSYDNKYSEKSNCFEVQKKNLQLMPSHESSTFTLPFLNYQDFAIFANKEEIKQYGTDIKIIRYVKNHFERREDDDSFHSQNFSDSCKVDIKAKIAEMRHKSQKKEKKAVVDSWILAIMVVLAATIIILVFLFSIYHYQPTEEQELLQTFSYEKQVRYYLPEYVTYFSILNKGINTTYFQNKLSQMQNNFIDTLAKSPYDQTDKQIIMKIIFNRSPQSMMQMLTSEFQGVIDGDMSVLVVIYVLWSIIILFCLGLVLMVTGILFNYKNTQLGVFTVFLSLKEPSIRKIYEACRRIIIKVNTQSNKQQQEEEDLLSQRQNSQEENEIQKIKQFRFTSTPEDKSFFLQMALPILVLIVYSLTTMFVSAGHFKEFISLKQCHNDYFQVIPSISTEFMKSVYKKTNHETLDLSTNFHYFVQRIETNLLAFQQNNNKFDFVSVLYGDVCVNSLVVPENHKLSCQLLQNGVLKNGIAPALNYLYQQLPQLQLQTIEGQEKLLSLLELQYMFINPIMLAMVTIMEDAIHEEILGHSGVEINLVTFGIAIFLAFGIYIFFFPIKWIQQQINTTTSMIALMPPDPLQLPSKVPANI